MKKKSVLRTLLLLIFPVFAFGQKLDYYISDAGNFNNPPWQILKFDENGQNGSVFTKQNLAWPQDILFLESDSQVLISNLNSGLINRHNADSGLYIGSFAGGIGGPTRMKIGSDGLLYVLQWSGNGKVLRYNLDGTFVDEFTDTGVPQSIGIDWDVLGNLYVSSYNGGYVRKFDSNGVSQGDFVSGLSGPTNILFRPNGDLLVLDYNAGNVKLYDSVGNSKGIFISGLGNPEGIAVLANGDIVIGNGATSSVKLFDMDGNFIKDLIPPGAQSLLIPNAVVTRIERSSSVLDGATVDKMIHTEGNQSYTIKEEFINQVRTVSFLNVEGKLLQTGAAEDDYNIHIADQLPGMYFLKIELKNGKYGTKKVIVPQ